MACEMQVDLLWTEAERLASRAEGDARHAEHSRIERNRRVDIGDCQNEMVEVIDRNHGYVPDQVPG